MEAVNTIQLYAMSRGDEQVLSSPIDLNHYQEIVTVRRLAEEEQLESLTTMCVQRRCRNACTFEVVCRRRTVKELS